MKKLKLKALQLGATELLSRTQLKDVTGGSGGPCLPRWTGCSNVTEDNDCCGSGKCMMYMGHEQCV
ncbi:hypothetical protein SAMN05192574_101830 [Mucilaginibacter gossypiicola]|uniref:Natural product n=1 Tax=Mucilaginibacter gossypiicola TaxID=551995 RepID=A0A1H8B8M3_9SPHI|nr:hypothetical protein [Mucilaginibacter gossypiicola]SEM79295.1 hypothetical protein SAMN05192574_101830 [Mucilaginibacter gossypiicola]